ncbi:hypothetical protein NUW54_g13549 [Trametes sanguinea]|uniref:Uncharacterized protein n=1 Tax=Trametes sanguinea TaxID=158606 RepID=A0ACC1MKT3_9APHY|nr:hypothetical protein NUW54_g13549 [Trametes sanguinea]
MHPAFDRAPTISLFAACRVRECTSGAPSESHGESRIPAPGRNAGVRRTRRLLANRPPPSVSPSQENEIKASPHTPRAEHAHYIVERAREALLWAWVVGRIGTLDDGWGDAEAERAWTELGGVLAGVGSEEVHVQSYRRDTLDPNRVYKNLREAGYNTDTRTELEFSSLDGYPYGHTQNKGKHGWGSYDKDDERLECIIKRSECFDVRGRASDLFKHIAFERPTCGDCGHSSRW